MRKINGAVMNQKRNLGCMPGGRQGDDDDVKSVEFLSVFDIQL